MKEYIPEKWVVVKLEAKGTPLTYKIFANWYGGYLNGDSWKLNSGIKAVSESKHYYLFEGFSGSIYKCFKNNYGMNMYGTGVIQDIIKKAEEFDGKIEIMPEDTNWKELKYE